MCNHDNKDLVGIADGIRCRLCGKIFATYADLIADRDKTATQDTHTDASEALPETFDSIGKEKDVQTEKPLKKASNAKSGSKAETKKAASKKVEE